MRIAFFLALLVLAGCRTESGDAPEATAEAQSASASGAEDVRQAPSFELTEPEPIEGAEPVTREADLTSAILEGNSCYLMVTMEGEERMLLAEPGVCPEASAIKGNRVRLTQQPSTIGAATCAGEPDCPEPEPLDVVTDIEVSS